MTTPRAGAVQAFGRQLTANPRFADARVILALDADPIGAGPEQVRSAHDMVSGRRSNSADEFLRLYAWSRHGHSPAPPRIIGWRCRHQLFANRAEHRQRLGREPSAADLRPRRRNSPRRSLRTSRRGQDGRL